MFRFRHLETQASPHLSIEMQPCVYGYGREACATGADRRGGVAVLLGSSLACVPWRNAFKPGTFTLEVLEAARTAHRFAVFGRHPFAQGPSRGRSSRLRCHANEGEGRHVARDQATHVGHQVEGAREGQASCGQVGEAGGRDARLDDLATNRWCRWCAPAQMHGSCTGEKPGGGGKLVACASARS